MLLEFNDLVSKYNMKINGILHVGAHLAEEAKLYHDNGINNVYWVEGNPHVVNKLKKQLRRYNNTLIEALVYSEDDVELSFNVTNYDGMSSSILEFGTHESFSPDIHFVDTVKCKSKKIDSLVSEYGIENVNLLNLDIQGAELYALTGAVEFLKNVDYIFTEINCDEVYVGCARVEQLDEFLSDFTRVETFWVGKQGWGDGLYVRTSLL